MHGGGSWGMGHGGEAGSARESKGQCPYVDGPRGARGLSMLCYAPHTRPLSHRDATMPQSCFSRFHSSHTRTRMKASHVCLLACLAAVLVGGATAQLDGLLGAVGGAVGGALSDRECGCAFV